MESQNQRINYAIKLLIFLLKLHLDWSLRYLYFDNLFFVLWEFIIHRSNVLLILNHWSMTILL